MAIKTPDYLDVEVYDAGYGELSGDVRVRCGASIAHLVNFFKILFFYHHIYNSNDKCFFGAL